MYALREGFVGDTVQAIVGRCVFSAVSHRNSRSDPQIQDLSSLRSVTDVISLNPTEQECKSAHHSRKKLAGTKQPGGVPHGEKMRQVRLSSLANGRFAVKRITSVALMLTLVVALLLLNMPAGTAQGQANWSNMNLPPIHPKGLMEEVK